MEAEFDQLLDRLQFESVETDLTPAKRRARRKNTDACDMAFAKTYFPKVFTHEFNDLHRHIASLDVGRYSVSGFPQSGKSAFLFLGKGMRRIALGMGGIFNVSARDIRKAEARTTSLTRIIKRNRLLSYDYGLTIEQDRAGYHIIKADAGTTHLVAGSVNTGLRSLVDDDFKRIRFAIADDLYDKESVRSELDNQRVFEWITGELWRQLEDDALCIVPGNSINEGCPINLLKKAYPDQHYVFPIRRGDGTSAWPERYTKEEIDTKEAETPADVWHSEYLDDPLEIGEVFDPAWIHPVRVRPSKILTSITAVDPSYGESPSACFKAAATLSILESHEVILTGIWIRRESYPALFRYLREVHLRTPNHRAILFEDDFSQWAFAQPYYMHWLELEKTPLPIVRHRAKDLKTEHRAADKESRIMTLVHPHQTGLFKYDERITGSSDFELYRRQYLGFGKHGTKKLDGLDAAATAYIMIRAYLETGSFKGLGRRKRERPSWAGGFH